MRIFRTFLIIVTISIVAPLAYAQSAPQEFSFSGSGYGHGVGLSQIGAKAMALAGESSTSIINYYFKDVQVVPVPDTQTLRVNVGHLLTEATMKSGTLDSVVQIFVGDIKDQIGVLPTATLTSKSGITFSQLGSQIIPSIIRGKTVTPLPQNREWTVRWSGTRYLDGTPSTLSLKIAGKTVVYRYGQFQVRSVKAGLLGYKMEITNSVRLHDEYLLGISEMSSSWPSAALEAQVIASRTYALNKAGDYKYACDCDLYSSIKDQSFVGYSKESELNYGFLWKSAVQASALDDNNGLAITYAGNIISAYFSSSSGGQSETSKNAWGTDQPYLVSVSDPSSLDPKINPRFYTWKRTVPQVMIAKAFGLSDVVRLEILKKNETGTVARISATSASGKTIVIRGETFRSRTQLPSAWFSIN
ncbi:unannotated protein [freshwater metagenome]|uniref:Unannotated protein n=1 Tax=freshwater metagenome TaxID=449393 RepID=A0A6J7XP86_9ZZZZ|nr:SpoIID/LytB domain-containing protein [Actinomycetota bacterium]